MGQLKNVVRLSETDYSTLLNGGSVTKGGKTYTLDANTLYVVEDETPPSYAQRSDYASEAGRAHSADCASRDADGNNIVETYATKDDVDAELSGKADKSATVSAVGYDTTNKKLTKTINGTTSDVVKASTVVTDGGGYKKPATGIPKTDLASAVQTSLGKADTALQSHQDISGKANLASPTFTGTPKAPTAASGTNTTQIATTAFVQSAVGGKSKVTVNQPTSGSGTGTQVTVDGTTYQVVADTDPGTTNGIDYKMAPTWHQVRDQLAAKADKSATVSTVGYDTTNKKLTKTINGTTSDVVTASTVVTDGGGYKKPAAGIPKTDLASAVQTSLGKADTALQSHQDITLKDSGNGSTGQRDLYVDAAAAGTIVTSFTPGSAQRPFVAPSWRAMLSRLSGKADKTDSLIVKRSTENNGVDFNMPDGSDNALYYVHTDYTQQNKPQQYGMLLNLCISAGHIQLFSDTANHLWFRTYWWTNNPEGFTYPSWMRIPTMGEVVTPSGLNTALADYAKTSDLPGDASTSQKGIVQLSGTISTDNAKAATPAAVNDALTAFAQQTQSRINEAVAGKSKVTVSQATSGTGTGTQVTVDGTTYQVVADTDPGTTNGVDYKMAPTWHQMRTLLAGKVDNSVAGANSLFSNMPTGTSVPTDTTYLIRQATSGEASFWRVPFSTVWDYIHSKLTATANTHDNMAGQRIIPISNPASGQVFAGCYGAVLQWTAYPNRKPSDGNPSWYFQLFGISDDKLYFRSRINGAAWSPVKRLAFANELPASTTYHLRLNTHVFQSGVTDTGNNFLSIAALQRNSAGVETLYTGTIVIKDATGTVRSTWANKCYATFSGSGFTTFANYSGPFTVELQNSSGTVLTSTQIVKV